MSAPRYAFNVAVVGDPDAMSAADLADLLDYLTAAKRDDFNLGLLVHGGGPDAIPWARANGYHAQLVPGTDGAVKRACEFVLHAQAVVVVGDPAPWWLLLWLCSEAGIPTRAFRVKPRRIPATARPAWEMNEPDALFDPGG